jgi:hypothetical protein
VGMRIRLNGHENDRVTASKFDVERCFDRSQRVMERNTELAEKGPRYGAASSSVSLMSEARNALVNVLTEGGNRTFGSGLGGTLEIIPGIAANILEVPGSLGALDLLTFYFDELEFMEDVKERDRLDIEMKTEIDECLRNGYKDNHDDGPRFETMERAERVERDQYK